METKKKTVSFSKLISNTYEEESVSLTGLCGFLIVVIPLLIIMFCIGFYFFNVQEANNIITIINSMVTIVGIGSGVIVGRKVSADFGPNNKIILEGRSEAKKIRKEQDRCQEPQSPKEDCG